MLTHPAHTRAPLLRYLQAEPVVRDHAGRMFSATDYVLTQPTCVPDQHSGDCPNSTTLSPVSLVLNLIFAPREQRLQTPPPVPIDHPGVVVIVDHGNNHGNGSGAGSSNNRNKRGANRWVIERGGATVQAVQEFLSDQLYLPTKYLDEGMVRAPYFDGEKFTAVSYSEIITAMGASSDPWDEAGARWLLNNRLRLAVYRVQADRLITPEEVAQLPYC
jgi:hypothetical protein